MAGELEVKSGGAIQQTAQEEVRWSAIESAMAQNNFAQLNPKERMEVLNRTCESMGLNPFGQPFGFFKMKDGSIQLYAKRACSEQLSKIHKLSVLDSSESFNEKTRILTIKVKMQDGEGRVGVNIGCVWISPNLTGEDLANQYMRCHTKAYRRCVLSICGLGFLDESEVNFDNETMQERKAQARLPKFANLEQRKELCAKIAACNDAFQGNFAICNEFKEFLPVMFTNNFSGVNLTEERWKEACEFCDRALMEQESGSN